MPQPGPAPNGTLHLALHLHQLREITVQGAAAAEIQMLMDETTRGAKQKQCPPTEAQGAMQQKREPGAARLRV